MRTRGDPTRADTSHNRAVYETYYSHDHLRIDRLPNRYDRALSALRVALIRDFGNDRVVADLGCGTGAYLLVASESARRAYGIDFSAKLLGICAERAREADIRVHLILADLQDLPLRDSSIDFAFSIATLYYVPDVSRAIREAARVVRPGGRILLELGNRWSLNTLVVRHSSSGVRSYHISVRKMHQMLGNSGLAIEQHRTFQLLPMYGGPLYLRPLVSARWKAVLGLSVGGRLLDEIVSSVPVFRQLAFRHLFVCRRVA